MNNAPIGIFDSGVGGISVLRTIRRLMPNERFIYLADFKNAPYGSKSKKEILDISLLNMDYLKDRGVKAVVVACNTATSAAINELRSRYNMPVIGIEPAIKPASQKIKKGKVLVLATPATLRFMKFQKLYETYGNENIERVECPGLSKLIENAGPDSIEIKQYLEKLLTKYQSKEISAVVIGCTHFSFIEKDIQETVGSAVIFDGRHGTARHLEEVIVQKDMIAEGEGRMDLISTHEDMTYKLLMDRFMRMALSSEEG